MQRSPVLGGNVSIAYLLEYAVSFVFPWSVLLVCSAHHLFFLGQAWAEG